VFSLRYALFSYYLDQLRLQRVDIVLQDVHIPYLVKGMCARSVRKT
jgi:hypothetical protein